VYEPAALAGAKIAYDRLVSMMQNWRQQPGEREINQEKLAKLEEIRNNFNQSLSDDLNTAKALAVVWGLAKSNLPSRDKLELIEEFDRVLGLQLVNLAKAKPVSVPLKVKKLAQDRKTCRQKGEYDQADQLRQKIDRLGWYLEDLPGNDYLLKPKE
jgi:cysteinyl-tRNA synthetase